MRIACLGDSITYGYGLARLHDRWTDLAAAQSGHEFLNFGISGDMTGGMLVRLHFDVFPAEPDAVILLGGVNDINTMGEYRTALGNMVSMIKHSSGRGIRIIMGLPLPTVPDVIDFRMWDWDRDNYRNEDLCRDYSRWLRCYCEEKNIPIADFHSAFLDASGNVRRELFIDGLHPTEEGHRIMADVVCKVLAGMD